ncbi:MAG: restriction endonuclease subunit S [Bacteroidaceae bacterium]|nr:restriction endonuclease subunit S [Bacteroidaceae bacterium]
MNIPQGYKQTELGIIPEDWQLQSVGKHCTVKARIGWQGLRSDEYLESGEYGLITSTDIVDGAINWDTCYFVDKSRYIQDPNIIIQEDDTLISKDGTIGKVGIVQNISFPSTLNSGVFVVRPKLDNVYKKYLAFAFKSVYFQNFINRLTAGSTIVHLYQKDIVKFVFPVPPLAEQRAIAEALSDVDGLIAALDKKIAKKRLLKQGAMQQLLTGKKCLPGFTDEWIKCELLTVCNVLDNKRIPFNDEQRTSGIYPYCGANGIVDYIDRYIFDEDLILIAEDGGNFDQYETRPIAYWMSGKYWVNNHAHVLKAKNEYNQRYIFYQLEHKDITDYIVGGTRTKLTRAQLDKIEISMPSTYAEQQAIATILSDMDKEIADLEAQRDKYRLLKSGMMQKLLTGQIRLKTE